MNKIRTGFSLVLALLIAAASICVSAAPNMNITGGVVQSPPENVFRLRGNDMEFILLDVAEDDSNSKFFVVVKSFMPKRAYGIGTSQKFDPKNPSNIAYFLNGEFLTRGLIEGFTRKNYRLPQGIIDHINFNHYWTTEAGRAAGDCPAEYDVQAGVALLSQTEFLTYQDKIGMVDDFAAGLYSPNFSGWWTRTGADSTEMITIRHTTSATATLRWSVADAGMNIRPAFWLNRDFFKEVPIDLATAGENVKAVFKRYYTAGELKNIYPESWIYDYLAYKTDVSLSNPVFTSTTGERLGKLTEGLDGISIEATVSNNISNATDGMLVVVKYYSNGTPQQIKSLPISLAKGESKAAELTMNFTQPLCSGDYIKVYYLHRTDGSEIISNAVRIS